MPPVLAGSGSLSFLGCYKLENVTLAPHLPIISTTECFSTPRQYRHGVCRNAFSRSVEPKYRDQAVLQVVLAPCQRANANDASACLIKICSSMTTLASARCILVKFCHFEDEKSPLASGKYLPHIQEPGHPSPSFQTPTCTKRLPKHGCSQLCYPSS